MGMKNVGLKRETDYTGVGLDRFDCMCLFDYYSAIKWFCSVGFGAIQVPGTKDWTPTGTARRAPPWGIDRVWQGA